MNSIADVYNLEKIQAAIREAVDDGRIKGNVFTMNVNLNGQHGGADVHVEFDPTPDGFEEYQSVDLVVA